MVWSVKYMEHKQVKHGDLSSIPRNHVKKKKTSQVWYYVLGIRAWEVNAGTALAPTSQLLSSDC